MQEQQTKCSNQVDFERDPRSTHNELPKETRIQREPTPTTTRPLHDDAHVFVVFRDAQDVHDGRFAAGFERNVTDATLRRRGWAVWVVRVVWVVWAVCKFVSLSVCQFR